MIQRDILVGLFCFCLGILFKMYLEQRNAPCPKGYERIAYTPCGKPYHKWKEERE